eukprot:m.51286 g.51286  ORF g.51286 m.51286 type:complete len:434 (+) comp11669_c0_seq1:817-2118(+)
MRCCRAASLAMSSASRRRRRRSVISSPRLLRSWSICRVCSVCSAAAALRLAAANCRSRTPAAAAARGEEEPSVPGGVAVPCARSVAGEAGGDAASTARVGCGVRGRAGPGEAGAVRGGLDAVIVADIGWLTTGAGRLAALVTYATAEAVAAALVAGLDVGLARACLRAGSDESLRLRARCWGAEGAASGVSAHQPSTPYSSMVRVSPPRAALDAQASATRGKRQEMFLGSSMTILQGKSPGPAAWQWWVRPSVVAVKVRGKPPLNSWSTRSMVCPSSTARRRARGPLVAAALTRSRSSRANPSCERSRRWWNPRRRFTASGASMLLLLLVEVVGVAALDMLFSFLNRERDGTWPEMDSSRKDSLQKQHKIFCDWAQAQRRRAKRKNDMVEGLCLRNGVWVQQQAEELGCNREMEEGSVEEEKNWERRRKAAHK